MATFKDRFLELKKMKGEPSLEDMAKILHTNKSSLSRVINGELSLKSDLLEAMAEYFGVSTDYLLGKTDMPYFSMNPENEKIKIVNELYHIMKDLNVTDIETLKVIFNAGVSLDDLKKFVLALKALEK